MLYILPCNSPMNQKKTSCTMLSLQLYNTKFKGNETCQRDTIISIEDVNMILDLLFIAVLIVQSVDIYSKTDRCNTHNTIMHW